MPLQDAFSSLVYALFCYTTFLYQLNYQLRLGLATHLVNTSVDYHLHVVLQSGFASQTRIQRTCTAYHTPVGADSTLEAQLVIQHLGAPIRRIVHIQGIYVSTTIVTHHSQSTLSNTSLERFQVIVNIVTRINGEIALASFMRVSARPVLQVYQHLVRTYVFALCTIHESLHHLDGQVSILREATHVATPTRLGDDVNLRT